MNPGEKIKWCQDCIVDPRHPNPTCEPADDVTDVGQNTPTSPSGGTGSRLPEASGPASMRLGTMDSLSM